MPTMVPAMVKRHAVDNKSGMPMYQPSTGSAAYQQAALAMQLQQQQFAPVTREYLFQYLNLVVIIDQNIWTLCWPSI